MSEIDDFRTRLLPKYIQEVKNKNNKNLQRLLEIVRLQKELKEKIRVTVTKYYSLKDRYNHLEREKKRLDKIVEKEM